MGIALRGGRSLQAINEARALKVAVVNELLVRRFFGARDPLGQRLAYVVGSHTDTAQIVGVVAPVKQFGLASENRPEFYTPFAQISVPAIGGAYIALHGSANAGIQSRALVGAVGAFDPMLPVSEVETLSQRMVESVGTTRSRAFWHRCSLWSLWYWACWASIACSRTS